MLLLTLTRVLLHNRRSNFRCMLSHFKMGKMVLSSFLHPTGLPTESWFALLYRLLFLFVDVIYWITCCSSRLYLPFFVLKEVLVLRQKKNLFLPLIEINVAQWSCRKYTLFWIMTLKWWLTVCRMNWSLLRCSFITSH